MNQPYLRDEGGRTRENCAAKIARRIARRVAHRERRRLPDEPTIAHVRWYDSLRSRSGTYRRCASGASQPSARGGGAPRVHERLNSGYGNESRQPPRRRRQHDHGYDRVRAAGGAADRGGGDGRGGGERGEVLRGAARRRELRHLRRLRRLAHRHRYKVVARDALRRAAARVRVGGAAAREGRAALGAVVRPLAVLLRRKRRQHARRRPRRGGGRGDGSGGGGWRRRRRSRREPRRLTTGTGGREHERRRADRRRGCLWIWCRVVVVEELEGRRREREQHDRG